MTHITHAFSGAGLGLKRELIAELQANDGQSWLRNIGFIEIAPENWMHAGGRAANQLAWFSDRFAMVCHGLSLSLGGPTPLNVRFLEQVKTFLDTYKVGLYTEHLSDCTDLYLGRPGYLYDLLPVPFTEESVRYIAKRIRQTQAILERRIAVENASFYVASPISDMSESAFIQAVVEEADCDLHLDVNNIYVNSVNFQYDPRAFLESLHTAGLSKRIVYGHIAGHYQHAADLIIDTHGEAVIDPVWQLLDQAYSLFGVFPTTLERDTHIPPLPVVMQEVNQIAHCQSQSMAHM